MEVVGDVGTHREMHGFVVDGVVVAVIVDAGDVNGESAVGGGVEVQEVVVGDVGDVDDIGCSC